jgi:hypothetical protein
MAEEIIGFCGVVDWNLSQLLLFLESEHAPMMWKPRASHLWQSMAALWEEGVLLLQSAPEHGFLEPR